MKTPTPMKFSLLFLLLLPLMGAHQNPPNCGNRGSPCPGGMCCSRWGYCGTSDAYCAPENCVSQCPAPPGPPNCGNRGAPCPDGMCCSRWGYCGTSDAYCAPGNCVSQCLEPSPPPAPPSPTPPAPPLPPPSPGGSDLSDIFSKKLFEKFLLQRNNQACPARGFYTYEAFIEAAKAFPAFGTTGNDTARKREIAAFFGQTSHETTGGWDGAPDGRFAWGYCFKAEVGAGALAYCVPDPRWPCVPGKKYYGRGPIQLSYNYNYGQAGEALGLDLLSIPDLVETDPVVSFKTAIWFWMTPQPPKPSCHDVMIGAWQPTPADIRAGRLPGYGMCTNIINGGLECGGQGPDTRVESRIGFYRRYCGIYGISPGDNLNCYGMHPFGLILTRASV